MAENKDNKVLNVPHKREQSQLMEQREERPRPLGAIPSRDRRRQSQTCLGYAERAGLHQNGNVPHLRFPEFSGEWEKYTIGELCEEFKSGKNIKAENIKEEGGACEC